MKKLLIGLSVALVATVWMAGSSLFFNSISASAEESGAKRADCEFHHGRHWGHHNHFWKKVNLTDDQKKEMFSIRLDERAKMKPLFQKLGDGRKQLADVERTGKFDEAKVQAIAKSQADILADIIVEKVRMKTRMYAVLTPEQRAKAEQTREQWKAHHDKEKEQK
jgi:Spy/CpxP family protein refolding chaperone